MTNTEERNEEKIGRMEALLFANGEPMSLSELADAIGEDEKEAERLLVLLEEEYISEKRGLKILHLEDRVQLAAKEAYYDTLIRHTEKPQSTNLTDALLESLAIIAYRQPATRQMVEEIRGVNSDHAIYRLTDMGLVEEAGRLDTPGHPILFRTTDAFLRRFGFRSKEDLPELKEEEAEEIRKKVLLEMGEGAETADEIPEYTSPPGEDV